MHKWRFLWVSRNPKCIVPSFSVARTVATYATYRSEKIPCMVYYIASGMAFCWLYTVRLLYWCCCSTGGVEEKCTKFHFHSQDAESEVLLRCRYYMSANESDFLSTDRWMIRLLITRYVHIIQYNTIHVKKLFFIRNFVFFKCFPWHNLQHAYIPRSPED